MRVKALRLCVWLCLGLCLCPCFTLAAPPAVAASCLAASGTTVAAEPVYNEQYTVEGYAPRTGIDATDEVFSIQSASDDEIPLRINNNGSQLCLSGGKYNTGDGDDAPWDTYHFGAAVYVTDSPGVILDNLTIDLAGDGVDFVGGESGVDGWTLRDTYIRHAGDDAIQNDSKFNGLIDDVLVDWAYQGVSCRADSSPALTPPGTVTIRDSLIALKPQEGTYDPASPPGHLFVFKWDDEEPCALRLSNAVFYMEDDNRVFDTPLDPRDFVLECADVTLVYAGAGRYTDQEGRLAALREAFGPDCFRVLEGEEGLALWRQQRTEWFYRHLDNAQVSYYRSREPVGARGSP